MLTGWQAHLNETETERDVVGICNQFLAMWTAAELGQLPEACRPGDRIAREDVSPYAVKLVLQLGNGDSATAPMLYRMSTFFAKAALRLAEIRAASRNPPLHDDALHTAFLTQGVLE